MNAVSVIAEDPRAALGAAPISAERPAGEDARASVEFDAIDGEIRKLDTDGPNAVDWRKVAQDGLDIIARQSKDFLVGAWVTFALFRREGLGGLAIGLSVLTGMVVDHWDDAFPPLRRERARVAALEWLVGRLAPSIAEQRYGDADAHHLVAIQDALDRIDAEVSARLKKESLSLGDLLRAVRPHADQAKRVLAEAAQRQEDQARRQATEAAAHAAAREAQAAAESSGEAEPRSDAPPLPASKVPAPSVAPVTAMSSAPIQPPADGVADVEALATLLWSQARVLQRQNIGDPRSYVLGRSGSWLRFDDPPPHQGGKTFIMPPTGLEAVELAADHSQIDAALVAVEDLVWASPFCLDVHRHAYELLGKLDRGFDAARATVLGMLGYFVRRFSGVAKLSFSDGRPFADQATLDLIASISAGSGAGSAVADPMTAAIGQARGLMGAGKAYEALDLVAQPLRRASSGRQRAHWQVAQAEFCIEQGYVAAALPLLDHLDRLVEARDLEIWEPELACAVTELRMRALVHPDTQMMLAGDRRQNAIEATRGRLARLDIGATARLLRP